MASTATHVRQPKTEETLNDGSKTVSVAGIAEALSSSSVPCYEVLIQAKRTNTGRIYIGGAAVHNDDTDGICLEIPIAGVTPPSIPISAQNLNQIYVNSTVNNEGVTFIYW